jgi:hypothetical protein
MKITSRPNNCVTATGRGAAELLTLKGSCLYRSVDMRELHSGAPEIVAAM